MTRTTRSIAALALLGGLALAPPAGAEEPFTACSADWGSLPETSPMPEIPAALTDVRSGEHTCFDRLVIDLGDAADVGYDVRYVDEITDPVSGEVTELRGAADLKITVRATIDGTAEHPPYDPAQPDEIIDVSDEGVFRQAALAWDYEGATTVGLGVRARLPMRTLLLEDPDGGARLVVDVARSW
ncbi:AMIN-like domain-containing (lipo)protein [Brachybacterium hainanense]|uniref:AMIN-like domain-containing protein n=1 Tax=Brachybacterium hainanense TaxID=1541174 RepID=A0ABV6REQ0_9MICO